MPLPAHLLINRLQDEHVALVSVSRTIEFCSTSQNEALAFRGYCTSRTCMIVSRVTVAWHAEQVLAVRIRVPRTWSIADGLFSMDKEDMVGCRIFGVSPFTILSELSVDRSHRIKFSMSEPHHPSTPVLTLAMSH